MKEPTYMHLVGHHCDSATDVRIGSKGEELTVSITSPLCGVKADIATRSADFAFGPIVLQNSLSISARNIDSRSGANTQQRFKRTGAPILLFQISISQSLLGDFCNTIGHNRKSWTAAVPRLEIGTRTALRGGLCKASGSCEDTNHAATRRRDQQLDI